MNIDDLPPRRALMRIAGIAGALVATCCLAWLGFVWLFVSAICDELGADPT